MNKTLCVLNHLLSGKSITSWEAITKYRQTRVSAVIYVLRKRGYDIVTKTEYSKETGSPYARYILLKNKKGA